MKQIIRTIGFTLIIVFVLASCTKESTSITLPPAVDAGTYQTIQLPINYATLSGTTTSNSISGYLWSLISGPNVPTITSPSSATTNINSLIAGTYTFQFSATDKNGLTGVDTVSILVKPSVQVTLTLQPANNPFDAHVDSYNLVGGSGDTEIEIGTWTINGVATKWRSFLKFDQSQIPASATIVSATLYLYAMPNPHSGDAINAHSGTANAYYVQRITSNWTSSALNWNSLPTVTTTNRVSVPQSSTSFENTTIDVKNLVQDMVTSNNYGFAFQLQNESVYNFRTYASSANTNATIRPKLVVTYQ